MARLAALILALFGLLSSAEAQTIGTLVPPAQVQFLDNNGVPLAGGKLFTYVPKSTTPKMTWMDSLLTQANTNPIILDSAGRATIWGNGLYREVLQDVNGNLIWDLESVAPQAPTSSSSTPVTPTSLGKSMTLDLLTDFAIPTTCTVSTCAVIFNNFEFDSLGGYSTITGTFSPTIRGVYLVQTSVYLNGTTTDAGGSCNLAIWRNGISSRLVSSISYASGITPAIPLGSLPLVGLFQLNGAGDNLQVKANCAGANIVAKGGSNLSYFSAAWLGPY